ncbi:hypothetical protein CBL_14642 [Carabus blaptoides fortunei]
MEDPNEISGPAESEDDKIYEHKGSDTDGDEVDDIELIFTTDETTSVIKEELVSIADGNEGECNTPVLLNYRTVDFETPARNLSCENMDKELEDDVFEENEETFETDNFENENTENFHFQNSSTQIHNSKSDNSINRDSINTENESQRDKSLKSCYSYQDSSFESRSLDKDESFDKFDDKEKYLHKMWSNNSVLVETDISKCGIVDPELPNTSARRNTCPNPVPYRPIMHREALAKHNTRTLAVKFSARNEDTPRPILNEKQSPKTESEAQTDISALPSLWKSESYLAHKVAHQFTTLPSKFPMPMSQKSLRLSEKTKEARRVLLSDINFTSMVPELSRSADHLYQEGLEVMQTCGYGQYLNPPGPQLRRYNTGDSLTSPSFIQSQKFTWSPSDYSNFSSTKFDNSNMYLNRYRGSLTSINMQNSFDLPDNVKRRSYSSSHWRQNVPASFDNSRFIHSAGQVSYRSVPNSPTRSRSVPFMSNYAQHMQQYPSGLRHSQSRFGKQGYGLRYNNGSLPELHGDHDSGDSTDSLVEEAEQYLRSSIDCIVSGRDMTHVSHHSTKRRSSAPCSGRDSSPPRNWQPFLPHGIKDLKSDNWVKVISPEGKIRGGRVRYVGYLLGQQEPFVGIELSTSSGNSDGSFNNRRYFECTSNHALFIPFKKVVMGWRN